MNPPNHALRATHEYHVHMYGCPTATMIWELAKVHKPDPQRLKWYALEFERLTGNTSMVVEFWKSTSGIELLQQEYLVEEPCTFARFQAAINLAIACFPLQTTTESPLFSEVMWMHRREGLAYVEYRVFLPPYFSVDEQQLYLSTLAHQCCDASDDQFQAKLAISVLRNEDICKHHYRTIKSWQSANPELAQQVVAIDFCGDECGFPPAAKLEFCQELHSDNRKQPEHALALLYHVGETIALHAPEFSLQWIWEAAELGAHRLGHASILGIKPELLANIRTYPEPTRDAQQSFATWLTRNSEILRNYGFIASDKRDESFLSSLQQAVARFVKDSGAIVESCPTSNFLLSGINELGDIPLLGLLEHKLDILICADDPGIFATTLNEEFAKAEKLGLSPEHLHKIKQRRFRMNIK